MKRYMSYLLALSVAIVASSLTGSCKDSCECDATSRTHLSVRPRFTSMSPELVSGFRGDRSHIKEDGFHGGAQFLLYGGKATNNEKIARYFLPDCKTSLIVDERRNAAGGQDILAQHFGIVTVEGSDFDAAGAGFRSILNFCPEYSFVGFGMHYRQSFWRNEEKGRGFWFSASAPIERVRTNMNMRENVLEDGGGVNTTVGENVFANMKEAFKSKYLCAGKIECGEMSETKLADIELKIGYEWIDHEPCHLESYLGIVIPTGTRTNDKFMFAPQVGNGHHFGILWGSSIGLALWEDEARDRSLRLEYAMNSQYLFANTQCRLFDLKCKPWSRYMEVYKNKEQAQEALTLCDVDNIQGNFLATSGTCVFYKPMEVTPGFSFNINGALVYNSSAFQGELGWNFFARRGECVKLDCPWQEEAALKHTDGCGQTNPVRDITGNYRLETITTDIAFTNYDANVIKESDLDLNSAATPAGSSHTFYAAIHHRWDERDYPLIAGVGGSFERGHSTNSMLDRWTLWAKLGVSF